VDPTDARVLCLPSGRLIGDAACEKPLPAGLLPTFGVYLLGVPPPAVAVGVQVAVLARLPAPSDRLTRVEVLYEAWARAESERVEIGCGGGRATGYGTGLPRGHRRGTAGSGGRLRPEHYDARAVRDTVAEAVRDAVAQRVG